MSHRIIGKLMPSRSPKTDINGGFRFKQKDFSDGFNIFNELTPERLRSILNNAASGEIGDLYDVYEKMLNNDTHYSGLISQLERAIAGMPIKVIPAHGTSESEMQLAEDYAAVMMEVMSQLDTNSLTKQFLDPFHMGVRLFQIKWEMRDYPFGRKIWMPVDLQVIPSRHLAMDMRSNSETKGQLMIRTIKNPEGIIVDELDKRSVILLKERDAIGNYHKIGVARKVLPWFLGIQYVKSWWIQYVEVYSSPIRIGKYPYGSGQTAKDNLEDFLRVLGQNGYGMFPAEMEIQLLEANRAGTITTYSDFIGKGQREMTVHILGQADTVSDNREGSRARMEESNSIRFETLKDGASIVEKGYNELSDRTLSANYGSEYNKRLRPKIRPLVITPQDMKTKTESALKLQGSGIAIPEDYFYDQIIGDKPRIGQRVIAFGQAFEYGKSEPSQRQGNRETESVDRQDSEDAEEKSSEGG